MEKVYIKAEYRIPGKVYSNGYICIDKDGIKGIFSLDLVNMKIVNKTLHLYLLEFDPESSLYFEVEEFVCPISFGTLESPYNYTLKSRSSGKKLELNLIKKVSELHSISNVINDFNTFFRM